MNNGQTWSTVGSSLSGMSGIAIRNNEFHLPGIASYSTITSQTGSIVKNVVADSFGVVRNSSGTAQTPYVNALRDAEEGLSFGRGFVAFKQVGLGLAPQQRKALSEKDCEIIHAGWIDKLDKTFTGCLAACGIAPLVIAACIAACVIPEPLLSKTACLLCVGIGGILAGGCIKLCIDNHNAGRSRADEWYRRCLQKAKAAGTEK
jgi:hypothetical protein